MLLTWVASICSRLITVTLDDTCVGSTGVRVAVTTTGARITAGLFSDGGSAAQAWIDITDIKASETEIK
ncbi:MAG: hypothetical protein ACE5FE_08100 [Acidiferrobacterales bacterium]